MATYITARGDTFDLIARKQYGDESHAERIRKANPGVIEPLSEGLVLAIPLDPNAPVDKSTQPPASDPDEVALKVGGDAFRYWEAVRIKRSLDSIDTVSFSAPFVDGIRPFSYLDIEVSIGSEAIFAGTLVSVVPSVEAEARRLAVDAYATCGVLNDCTMPASSYPLEFRDQTLAEIAPTLADAFGVGVSFAGLNIAGAPFPQVAIQPGEKVLEFLQKLAKQRNLIIGSSPDGGVEFRQPAALGLPTAALVQGQAPLQSVAPRFNNQEFYSHVTGLEVAAVGKAGAQATTKNSTLSGIVRPFAFELKDTENADSQAAVDAKAARMFAGAVSYSVTVATWRDSIGQLWEPGKFLTLEAPDAFVPNAFSFMIRGVIFERSAEGTFATLELVLPGVFGGDLPRVFPWGT